MRRKDMSIRHGSENRRAISFGPIEPDQPTRADRIARSEVAHGYTLGKQKIILTLDHAELVAAIENAQKALLGFGVTASEAIKAMGDLNGH